MRGGPVWALVRTSIPFSDGGRRFARGELLTVDLTRPGIRAFIADEILIPLPAAEQPMLRHDPETNLPQIVREGSDGF